ncbi:MAG: sedoheptulokinase [Spirochaetota bacterium]
MDVLLGIDFGTTKLAFTCIEPNERRVVTHHSIPIGADLHLENPSLKEQDITRITEVFYEGLRDFLKEREYSLLSIGLTGQMHGILGVGKGGKAVTNLVTWQDQRGYCRKDNGNTLIEEMHQKAGLRPVASGYGVVTLYDWVRVGRQSDIEWICTIPDYFAMLLTGKNAPVMDYTMADSTGAFDNSNRAWDFAYLEALGIERRFFPEAVHPTTVIGVLNDPSIRRIQSNERVPIAVSIGDNQASYLGSVREHFDSLLVNIGTGSQISFTVKDPRDSDVKGLIDGYDVVLRPFVSGNWLVAGNAISGGVVYRALYDFFKKTGADLFGITSFEKLWERMGELAMEVKDCRGLDVYPLFEGKRSDPDARGSIKGISIKNLIPGCLILGTLKGMVKILIDMIKPGIIEKRKFLIGSGNGIRKNPVLRVVTSELFERQILVPAHEEEAAVGAAINGGVASGVFKDFDEAKRVIQYL